MLWMALAWGGSDVSIESMTVDGLEIRDVSCSLQGFSFTWMVELQQSLAASKKPGDACVPKGAAVRVRWNWQGRATAKPQVVKSTATSEQQQCLSRVLTLETAPLDATCELTLLYGEPTAARAAAEKL